MPKKPLRWTKPQVSGADGDRSQIPSPRSGYSMTLMGVNAYLFGGLDSATVPPQASEGLFCVRLADDACDWKKIMVPEGSARPVSRWRHTATQISPTAVFVFGGFHTHDERLNDQWILDTITLSWSRPEAVPLAASGNAGEQAKDGGGGGGGGGRDPKDIYHLPLQEVERKDVPAPRGGHSATMVGSEFMWLFGGYGGFGYTRRDLEDLHCLDTTTMRWSECRSARGVPPEKRSGHSAQAVQQSLVVCGGKNSTTEFQDIHVLDCTQDPPVWSNHYDALPECRWNFAMRSFIAMPKWRMFVFGGKARANDADFFDEDDGRGGGGRGGGGAALRSSSMTPEEISNDVLMVDTSSFRVTKPLILGTPPPARADMEVIFDPKHGQLLVFSGYGAEWLDDMHSLDISSMVGPSYLVKDVYPRMGPVTGGTELEIVGLDFPNSSDVTVRFEWESPKTFIDCLGTFESQAKLTVRTPDLSMHRGREKLGQSSCKIRVALDGDSFTLTTTDFYFHSVTEHWASLLFGPGVLEAARDPENNKLATQEETVFVIQGKDKDGKNRTTGGDEVTK